MPSARKTPKFPSRQEYRLKKPILADPGLRTKNALNIPWAEVDDISAAVLFLASDESRWITGTQQVIYAGALLPFGIAR